MILLRDQSSAHVLLFRRKSIISLHKASWPIRFHNRINPGYPANLIHLPCNSANANQRYRDHVVIAIYGDWRQPAGGYESSDVGWCWYVFLQRTSISTCTFAPLSSLKNISLGNLGCFIHISVKQRLWYFPQCTTFHDVEKISFGTNEISSTLSRCLMSIELKHCSQDKLHASLQQQLHEYRPHSQTVTEKRETQLSLKQKVGVLRHTWFQQRNEIFWSILN